MLCREERRSYRLLGLSQFRFEVRIPVLQYIDRCFVLLYPFSYFYRLAKESIRDFLRLLRDRADLRFMANRFSRRALLKVAVGVMLLLDAFPVPAAIVVVLLQGERSEAAEVSASTLASAVVVQAVIPSSTSSSSEDDDDDDESTLTSSSHSSSSCSAASSFLFRW